jgi:cobalt/nickel transport system permease protein
MEKLINPEPNQSIFCHWEPRAKIIAFSLVLLSFTMVKSLALVMAMLLTSSIIFSLSGLPAKCLLHRWKIPAFPVLLIGLILLFFSKGQPQLYLGPLPITQEGLVAILLILSRLMCMLALIAVLLATTPLLLLINAMRDLGLPGILADMILFTLRYLYTLNDQLEQMKRALTVRGFSTQGLSNLKQYGILIGAILVRSFEQSDRVYRAMAVRGYKCESGPTSNITRNFQDKVLFYSFSFLAFLIALIQLYFNMPGV